MSSRDPLDDLFARWKSPASPNNLQTPIRRAIAQAQAAARPPWYVRLEVAFSRPSFAVTFVAACVLFGLFLAEARVSRLNARYGSQIARNYVQLIDPLLGGTEPTAPVAPKP